MSAVRIYRTRFDGRSCNYTAHSLDASYNAREEFQEVVMTNPFGLGTGRISKAVSCLWLLAMSLCIFVLQSNALAESCMGAGDMDAATRSALESTAKKYFDMASKGDTASLQQNAIPSLASSFGGVEAAVRDNQANFAGASATPRSVYLLKEEAPQAVQRAEFFCGVFGANGQTANSAVFVIPNLSPGTYGIAILDVAGSKAPYTLSFVLEQAGAQWKLGGFYAKPAQVSGHDGNWFMQQARQYKAKGQTHNAWFYFMEAHELLTPVDFMSTLATDKLYEEAETVKPSDLPSGGGPAIELPAAGQTYKVTTVFPLVVGNDLDLVAKFQYPDVSNTGQAFQANVAVIKALVNKFPEFRDAFAGVVARAVEPSGRDYGTLLPMKEIK